jgi:hypothetical protein
LIVEESTHDAQKIQAIASGREWYTQVYSPASY